MKQFVVAFSPKWAIPFLRKADKILT